MTDTPSVKIGNNPYVGPRPFNRGETLYGRKREVSKLLNLVIAERIVMLYSPSGAGKTSLLRASLIPRLEKKRFDVWPIMRVNQALPQDELLPAATNRYIYSILDYLERDRPESEQIPSTELAQLTLLEYLERRRSASDNPPRTVLIFDQFEEILTIDPTNRPAKQAFFEQVGEALHQRWIWAIFSLREDYIAGLDPYLLPIPNRLETTFRLELLDKDSAREAMQGPAHEGGVTFTAEAADKLTDNLSIVRVQQRDGAIEEKEGLYVEPVQLQVVCRRLWDEKFPPDRPLLEQDTIIADDVESVGDVDSVLGDYYAERVGAIAAQTGVSERAIRDWCGDVLITETGIRGQVLSGSEQGLADAAVQGLINAYLVRAEERRNATWYELAHDRLVEPVRWSNTAWEAEHLHPLQRQAALWYKAQRPDGLLFQGEELAKAEQWAKTAKLLDFEETFLEESKKARKIASQQKRQQRRIKILSGAAIGIGLVTIITLFQISQLSRQVDIKEETVQAANTQIVSQKETVSIAITDAVTQKLLAQNAKEAAKQQEIKAQLAIERASVLSDTLNNANNQLRALSTQKAFQQATVSADITAREIIVAELNNEVKTAEAEAVSQQVTAFAIGTVAASQQQTAEAVRNELETQLETILATTTSQAIREQLAAIRAENAIAATRSALQTAEAVSARATIGAATAQARLFTPTFTPVPSATPTATPIPVTCTDGPYGEFRSTWEPYQNRLGCALQPDPTIYGNFAEQSFANGFMFWSEFQNLVLAIDTRNRTWFPPAYTWSFVPNGSPCPERYPPDGQKAVNAFGGVWCDHAEIRETLGFPSAPERGMGGGIQAFDRGWILRNDDQSRHYVLFKDNMSVLIEER